MGREKLLMPVAGRSVLERTLAAVKSACPDLLVSLVVPADGPVRDLAVRLGSRCHENAGAEEGIASSLRIAVTAAGSPPLLIFLGDEPMVSAAGVDAVRAAYAAAPDLAMAAPWYRGEPGHPVLVAERLFPAILDLRGDRGARSLWSKLSHDLVRRVDVDEDPPPDLDTPDDYEWWVSTWREPGDV
jgi:molybdenum cofactor cytidylyltransferase